MVDFMKFFKEHKIGFRLNWYAKYESKNEYNILPIRNEIKRIMKQNTRYIIKYGLSEMILKKHCRKRYIRKNEKYTNIYVIEDERIGKDDIIIVEKYKENIRNEKVLEGIYESLKYKFDDRYCIYEKDNIIYIDEKRFLLKNERILYPQNEDNNMRKKYLEYKKKIKNYEIKNETLDEQNIINKLINEYCNFKKYDKNMIKEFIKENDIDDDMVIDIIYEIWIKLEKIYDDYKNLIPNDDWNTKIIISDSSDDKILECLILVDPKLLDDEEEIENFYEIF